MNVHAIAVELTCSGDRRTHSGGGQGRESKRSRFLQEHRGKRFYYTFSRDTYHSTVLYVVALLEEAHLSTVHAACDDRTRCSYPAAALDLPRWAPCA